MRVILTFLKGGYKVKLKKIIHNTIDDLSGVKRKYRWGECLVIFFFFF
jgi:hypothetical protein